MIRTAVFSDDLHSEYQPALEIAAREGVEGIAVRNVGGRNIVDVPLEEVRVMAARSAASGVAVASVGSQFGRGMFLTDETDRASGLDIIHRAAERAHILGTGLVRGFALWVEGHDELSTWADRPDVSGLVDRVAERLSPFVTAAEKDGVMLMFELEGASYIGTAGEASLVLPALNTGAAALCWDVCNGWWSGENPLDALRITGSLPVVDVQTKDALPRRDNPLLPTFDLAVSGSGGVGYDKILPELKGRDGEIWVTVERVHHPRRPEAETKLQQATIADIRAVQRILADPRLPADPTWEGSSESSSA